MDDLMALISVYDNMNWEYVDESKENILYSMKKPDKELYKKIVSQNMALTSLFGEGDYEWVYYPKKMQMLKRKKEECCTSL